MSKTEIVQEELDYIPETIEIAKEERIVRQEPFYKLINDRREKLLPILDDDNSLLEKMARSFVFTIYKDGLTQCNQQSIIEAFIKCCELKLDPVSGIGKVYLINYNGSLNVQVGYQGWLELLWRSPLVSNVYSNVVYEEDEFEVEYGNSVNFRHKPRFLSDKLKMTYATVKLNNGELQVKTASMKEILESKTASKGSSSHHSPWNKYFDAMAQIVPLRKLAKNLSLAIRNDDEFINNEIKNLNSDEIHEST